MDACQCRTSREGIVADFGDGVGDGDGCESSAGFKCLVTNVQDGVGKGDACHGSAAVEGAEAHGSDGIGNAFNGSSSYSTASCSSNTVFFIAISIFNDDIIV